MLLILLCVLQEVEQEEIDEISEGLSMSLCPLFQSLLVSSLLMSSFCSPSNPTPGSLLRGITEFLP